MKKLKVVFANGNGGFFNISEGKKGKDDLEKVIMHTGKKVKSYKIVK